MKKSLILLPLMVAAVVGCQQNPYTMPGVPATEMKAKRPELPPYSIQVMDQLVFEEGKEARHSVIGQVTDGTPVLIFKDLPKGAIFDSGTNELIWTPNYDAADDVNKPRETRKYIPIRIGVASSLNLATRFEKVVTLVVNDTPRPMQLTLGNSNFSEAVAGRAQITINDKDVPAGPFVVTSSNLPAGAMITPTADAKIFDLTYTPDVLTAVKARSTNKSFNVKVINPRGYTGESNFNLIVSNNLIDPVISGPTDVVTNSDVAFEFTVLDPNNEDYPTANLVNHPRDGKLELTEVSRSISPSPARKFSVLWRDIPVPTAANRNETVVLSVCANSKFTTPASRCVKYTVDVTISSEGRVPPTVDRSEWPLGQTRYYKEGSQLTVPVNVTAQNAGRFPLNVKIEPANLASYVSWQNNSLSVRFPTAGSYQFDLIASVGQATQKESFVVEVLPPDWAQNVVLSANPVSTDANAILNYLSSGQLLVPSLYPVDLRIFSERKGVFIGPEMLAQQKLTRAVTLALKSTAKKIFFYGTNIEDLPMPVRQSMNQWGVRFNGKVEIATNGQSNILEVSQGSKLSRNRETVFLKGQMPTNYSKISTFAVGSGACVPLLEMQVPSLVDPAVVAVSCAQGKSEVVLASFHWADLGFDSSQDPELVKNWIEGMLNR